MAPCDDSGTDYEIGRAALQMPTRTGMRSARWDAGTWEWDFAVSPRISGVRGHGANGLFGVA